MNVYVIAALLSVGAMSAPGDEAAIRKELTARYNAISSAFAHRKINALMEPLLPDFTAKQPGGRTVTREQVEADFKRQSASMRSVEWKRKIETVTMKGGSVVVLVSGRLSGTVSDGPKHTHKLLFTAKTLDTWKPVSVMAEPETSHGRMKTKWMLQESVVIESHMEVDGRPADQQAPAGG